MASGSKVFSQSFKFARQFKLNGSNVQRVLIGTHVPNSGKKLCNVQLARPTASVCGWLNGPSRLNTKSKIPFAPEQVSNISLVARSAPFLNPVSQGSEESGVATSEGSDSSCEAMEGPHGDDDGLVINDLAIAEDL